MIPVYNVDIELEYDMEALEQGLAAEDIASGFSDHHGYQCMGLPSWQDAAAGLRHEAEFLAQARASESEDGIESLLEGLCEKDDVEYVNLIEGTFYGNDPGVAGLCLALSAAQTATFYSCASSLTAHHNESYPVVGVLPDRQRAELIAQLAARSGCGIGQRSGRWYIYGKSVSDLHSLGQSIVESREAFDALPAPSWAYGLQEALDELEEE